MTLSRIRMILVSVFFLAITVVIGWLNVTRPKLLILQSYDTDYIWTKEVDVGIDRVLGQAQFIHVRRFYMKTKKFHDKASLKRASITARHVIEQDHPDVILAVDDYAQKLAAKYYVNNPSVKIVFAGVNGQIHSYGYDKANNVTGILERKPVRAIVQAITRVCESNRELCGSRKAPRAVYFGDDSYTVAQDSQYMLKQDWSPVRFLGTTVIHDFPEWKQRVLSLRGKVDILLVGGYRTIKRSADGQKLMSPTKLMRWTQANSPVPVVGMDIFNSKDGVMLSVGVSPYEQGEISGKMALELLNHQKKISDIPIVTSRQFLVAMRGSELKKRDIVLPSIYEAFARATQNYFN